MCRRKIYNIVNIVILSLCTAMFLFQYLGVFRGFFANIPSSIVVLLTMSMVLIVKYFRIYFIFYGLDISIPDHTKLFFKTTFVNLLIPFKLGDAFRGYCYGFAVKSYVQGFCYILLDRFMDTLALVTVLGALSIISGNSIPFLLFAMIFFLTALIILYATFPSLYRYWNRYFLEFNATERKLLALSIIDKLNKIYKILKENIYSKGIILYVLSLTAWAIEGMGFLAIVRNKSIASDSIRLLNYLNAALGVGTSREHDLSLLACIIISILAYACGVFSTKKRRISK